MIPAPRTAGGPAGGRWRVGLSGSGFVARGIYAGPRPPARLHRHRRADPAPGRASAGAFPEALLTNSIERLAERADIVFECSGDTLHAAEVLMRAGEAGAGSSPSAPRRR